MKRPADTSSIPALLTVREVQDALRVSERSVRRMIRMGHLEGFYVGPRKCLRVTESSVRQLLNPVTGERKVAC